jgi:hypothetical protein
MADTSLIENCLFGIYFSDNHGINFTVEMFVDTGAGFLYQITNAKTITIIKKKKISNLMSY